VQTLTVSGRILKRLREAKGWNQTQAARQYGISRPYLARLESGDRQPSPAVAKRIAEVHELHIGDILTTAEAAS
jgi:transcriptional regulator with XRE-family HTH domain